MDAQGGVPQLIEHACHTGRNVRRDVTLVRGALAGEDVQVVAFEVAQAKRAGNRGEDLDRGGGGATTLESHDVVHGQACQRCEFLAPQSGRSPDTAGRQADIGGAGAITPVAQCLTECRGVVHRTSVPHRETNSLVLAHPLLISALSDSGWVPQADVMTTYVITGANKGLGFETARCLIDLGHTVFLGARDRQRGSDAARTLGARPLLIDITDDASVCAAADAVRAEVGYIDVLVNNAGIAGPAAATGDVTAADLQEVFDTNVFGAVRTTRAFLPLLQASKAPAVVNVSSSLGSLAINADPAAHTHILEAWAPLLAYNSSKAALNMLTILYAQAYPQLTVTAVDPGFTATDLNGHQGAQSVEEGAAAIVAVATAGPAARTATFSGASGLIPW